MTSKILNKLYNNPGTGTWHAGETTLLAAAKEIDPTIKRENVVDFLKQQKVYQLTNETNRTKVKEYPKAVATRPNALVHCDLAFWSKNNIVFLICRDIFSSMTYAQFMGKGKDAKRTLNAFQKIESRVKGGPIFHVAFDQGKEFTMVADYMKEKGAQATKLSSWQHAFAAEAAIKDIRQLYRKYKAKHDGKGDIRKLMPKIISTINNRPSRITGLKPSDAVKLENWGTVWEKKFFPYVIKAKLANIEKRAKYKPGDTVKILNLKSASDKQGMKKPLTKYSTTNFTINSIKPTSYPISYTISDPQGRIINRSYYERHLFKVPK